MLTRKHLDSIVKGGWLEAHQREDPNAPKPTREELWETIAKLAEFRHGPEWTMADLIREDEPENE